MKTKSALAALTILLAASASHAATTVSATGSGEWNSTVPDKPWPGGVSPQSTDNADIEAPFNVTVATTASVDYIYGSGTVTVGTNATLTIVGSNAGEGTQSLGLLDTTAPGNTVVYQGNAFWCKHQNYYNLSLVGNGNLYNGEIGVAGDGDFAMTIFGNLVLGGTANIQQADSFTIFGNLTIGPGSFYDTSCSPITVMGNTTLSGVLKDGCGSSASLDDVFNNITVTSTGNWSLGDVIEWSVGGSLTNNGTISGIGYAKITFVGTGVIAGNHPITTPDIAFNGTNAIENTIEITTNTTPGFEGTLVYDLAHPGEIMLPQALGQQLYFNSTLNITNTGTLPTANKTYKLFDAIGYNDPYTFTTINPLNLPANYSLTENNLTIDGTISLFALSLSASPITNNTLMVSWDNTTFPGFHLQVQTNKTAGVNTNWFDAGAGSSSSPFSATVNPANKPVFFRLSQ